MKVALDHVVYAAPDLRAACEAFEAATGTPPMAGGRHEGLGTCNALVSFDPGCYLEIIAPDPALPEPIHAGARLATLPTPQLFHWALRSDDLSAVADALRANGLEPTPPIETRRAQPDGRALVWELMGLPGRGGAWPFFIDWRDCPHPSRDAPRVGSLEGLEVRLPAAEAPLLSFVQVSSVSVEVGGSRLSIRFDSARGTVAWKSDEPTGFFA